MEDKEDKEELMNKEELTTLPTLQGTLHCSCLEHCFSFTVEGVRCGVVVVYLVCLSQTRPLSGQRNLLYEENYYEPILDDDVVWDAKR